MGCSILGGVLGFSLAAAAHSEDEKHVVTDEQIAAMFQRSHNIMKAQRERMHAALDGFLLGDLQAVQQSAQELETNITSASQQFAPQHGREAEQWEAMAALERSAQQMNAAAAAGRYQQAYQQYTIIVNQCIRCHQVRRDQGLFAEPKAADKGSESSSSGSEQKEDKTAGKPSMEQNDSAAVRKAPGSSRR